MEEKESEEKLMSAKSNGEDARVPSKKRGLARLLAATKYSAEGLRACYKSEEAFRIEIFLSVFLVPLALFLGETALESAILLLSIALVLIVELLNSAVEATIDRVGPGYHDLAKKAKDIASGAVFISLLTFLLVWAVLLLDRFSAANV